MSAVASSDLRIYKVKGFCFPVSSLLLCVVVQMQTRKTLALSHACAHPYDTLDGGNT